MHPTPDTFIKEELYYFYVLLLVNYNTSKRVQFHLAYVAQGYLLNQGQVGAVNYLPCLHMPYAKNR